MARRILLDTGVVIALVNRRDRDHERCVAALASLRARLITVEGVLVEACHLLRKVPLGQRRAIELVLSTGTEVFPATPARLVRALELLARFEARRMDLVDALLVVAAEELEVSEILTLDRRDFTTYRLPGNKGFTMLPPDGPAT